MKLRSFYEALADFCISELFYPKINKFQMKLGTGITFYRYKKNEFMRSYKTIIFNRRLQTQRIMTHTKK